MNAEVQAITGDRPVLRAIVDIMSQVGAVEKKGRNDFHKYDYATAADVAHALQKRMADAGLVIIPTQRKMELIADDQMLVMEFEFLVEHVSGDKLDERPVFTGMARARDSKGGFDDKAANKCLTAASKYFALHLFRIPTGDYHDADATEDAGKPPMRQHGNGAAKVEPKPATVANPSSATEQSPEDLKAQMLRTIEAINDVEKLYAWSDRHAAAFGRLPPDDRQFVKEAAERRLHFLAQAPAETPHDRDTGEVIEGDVSASHFANYDQWVSDQEAALKAASDDGQAEIWEQSIEPRREAGEIFPPDLDRLKRLLRNAT